jgi:hypothetical protein
VSDERYLYERFIARDKTIEGMDGTAKPSPTRYLQASRKKRGGFLGSCHLQKGFDEGSSPRLCFGFRVKVLPLSMASDLD